VAQHQIALTFDVWTIFGGQDDGEKIMFNLVAALLVLPVLGLGGLQGDGLAASRSVRVPRVRDLLLRHYPVDFLIRRRSSRGLWKAHQSGLGG